MEKIQKYQIKFNQTILEALNLLNCFDKTDVLTLFVVDENDTMCGTLTDGDIRRKLVEGCSLNEDVSQIMYRDFCYLLASKIDVTIIRSCKDLGISLIPILDDDKKIVDVVNLKRFKSYLPIDAVLMAGGKGERLRPLTEKTPKPLLKVGRKPIIDYNVDRLISYGIKQISVTVNYLREQIEEHFSSVYCGVQVNCVREPKYLGTIGSVQFVDAFHNDTVLIMNSDLFTNIDYESFYFHFCENNADMSVAAVPYIISVPYGVFDLEGRNIRGVKEKPTYNYYANAGIYLIKKELLNLIPNDEFFNATDFMEFLIKKNKTVIRFPITGYWIDVGKHEDLVRAKDLAKHLF